MPRFYMRAILWSLLLTAPITSASMAQIGLGSKQNSDQPIEIASDTLEVQQDKQLAIFRGKVDVVQGDTRLRSDELYVYYRDRQVQQSASAQGREPPPRPSPAATGGPDAGSITKIEAKGNVFVSTPKERAQGNFGVYDVDKKTITLTGDVLLTSDQSTVRCQRAVMHQDTGRSTCDPVAGGRVRGVFIPNNAEPAPDPAQRPAQGTPETRRP